MLPNEELKTGLLLLSTALENERQLDSNEVKQLGKFIMQCIGDVALNKALQAHQVNTIINERAMEFMLDVTYLPRHWQDAREAFDITYQHYLKIKNNEPLNEEQKQPMDEFMRHLAVFHQMAQLQTHFDPLVKLKVISMNDELSALHDKMRMCKEMDEFLDKRAMPSFLAGHRATQWNAMQYAKALHAFASPEGPDLTPKPQR